MRKSKAECTALRKRIHALKDMMPSHGVIPIFLTKHPEYNTKKGRSDVYNVWGCRKYDSIITEKLEEFVRVNQPDLK